MNPVGHPPKAVEPSRHEAMKQENTVPKGMAAVAPNCEAWMAALSAGGHCNTKMYIAPDRIPVSVRVRTRAKIIADDISRYQTILDK